MATFAAGINSPANFANFDIADLMAGDALLSTNIAFRIGADDENNVFFQGVGFAYTNGALTGGTIQSISGVSDGTVDFSITGMSMSVAAFNAYYNANNTAGFLQAVFASHDSIYGSAWDDSLLGYAGNDTIDGWVGADTMAGGAGNDTYHVNTKQDVIQENLGEGVDTVRSAVTFELGDYVEHLVLTGALNIDATGNSVANSLTGNSGGNLLDGGLGNDTMAGGKGDDRYILDVATDVVTEGANAGTDIVWVAFNYTVGAHIENAQLYGAGNFNLTGNGLDNHIYGNGGNNVLNGGAGADSMNGFSGNDTYVFDNIGDTASESSEGGGGIDLVNSSVSTALGYDIENLTLTGAGITNGTGNSLANVITGNGAANILSGSWGDDALNGGGGNDTLVGGRDDDTLNVSAGNDRVRYTSTLDGHDVVTGFDGNATGGQDVLDLDWLFDSLGVAAGSRAGRVYVGDNGASVDVWVDTNGDAFLDLQVATLNTADAVTVGQDILVS